MDNEEAEALAHIARTETGMEAWTEQSAAGHLVVLRDRAADRRFVDAASYRRWRGGNPDSDDDKDDSDGARGRSSRSWFGAVLGFIVGIFHAMVSSPVPKRVGGVSDYSGHGLGSEQAEDLKSYGDRITHPGPDERRSEEAMRWVVNVVVAPAVIIAPQNRGLNLGSRFEPPSPEAIPPAF